MKISIFGMKKRKPCFSKVVCGRFVLVPVFQLSSHFLFLSSLFSFSFPPCNLGRPLPRSSCRWPPFPISQLQPWRKKIGRQSFFFFCLSMQMRRPPAKVWPSVPIKNLSMCMIGNFVRYIYVQVVLRRTPRLGIQRGNY